MNAKNAVTDLLRAYRSRDAKQIEAALHPNAVWIAPRGNATAVALGQCDATDAGAPDGSMNLDRKKIAAFIAHNLDRLFRNVNIEMRSIVAEGNTVVIEQRFSATLPNGRSYVNDYCFVYEVEEGKVRTIREYMDTRGGWAQIFEGASNPGPLLPFLES
jgi:uncharacterized protein